jgi:hypothetical protein
VSKPIIILVHPGSLHGSFITANDYHPSWPLYAVTQRKLLLNEFSYFAGVRISVRGGLVDDEVNQNPEIREAVARADERYRADADSGSLRSAAIRIAKKHPQTREITVTGDSADPKGGCAWTLCREIRKLVPGAHVRLSEYAARRDIPAARIAAGCKTTLGKDTRRVKWHVLKDSHAYTHNQGRQENMISRDPRWQTLTDRLLRIGGAVVCAFPEEDMDLILKEGRTWTPRQSRIFLKKGASIRCHSNSLFLKEANPHLLACTGWALSKDGIWRQHSWCIDPQDWRVVETTQKRLAYHGFILPAALFKERLWEAII